MSHFTIIKTKITNHQSLVVALADVGFTKVEVHESAQHLYGYMGDKRPQTAEIIIRRKFVGVASNDIGFKRQEDGSFEAVISAFDRGKYSNEWLNRLTQRYAYHVTRAKLEEQGFTVVNEEKNQSGQIHLVLRRVV